MLEGPFPATLDDFEGIVACANACFPPPPGMGGMEIRAAHCYRREPDFLSRFLVMKDAGRVVACLGCITQILAVDGDEVPVSGVSGVATLPDYRGQGLMSRLLPAAISLMRDHRCAFSELGGDRLRYGRYGWETAGREWAFTLTPRAGSHTPPPGLTVRRYEPADQPAITAIHDAEPRRVVRDEAQYRRLLSRPGRDVWVAIEKGGPVAYAISTATPAGLLVPEFGGDRDGLHALLAFLLGGLTQGEITLPSPWAHPANPLFTSLAANFVIRPLRMLRLLDLAATLRGFRNQITRRLQALHLAPPRPVGLKIAETGEAVALVFDGSGFHAEPGSASPCIELPRRDMTRFLFGPFSPEVVAPLPADAGFLNALFPLDFTIWRNEGV